MNVGFNVRSRPCIYVNINPHICEYCFCDIQNTGVWIFSMRENVQHELRFFFLQVPTSYSTNAHIRSTSSRSFQHIHLHNYIVWKCSTSQYNMGNLLLARVLGLINWLNKRKRKWTLHCDWRFVTVLLQRNWEELLQLDYWLDSKLWGHASQIVHVNVKGTFAPHRNAHLHPQVVLCLALQVEYSPECPERAQRRDLPLLINT